VTLALSRTQVLSNTAGQRGGGLYQADAAGRLNLTGCRVEDNEATSSYGGGLYVAGSATLSDTQVISNTATRGGGLCQFSAGGRVDVVNSYIERNTARSEAGGGLWVLGNAALTETQVISNTALSAGSSYGGGLYIVGSADVTGGRVERNTADYGGGLYVGGTATLAATQVVSNTAGDYGGGLWAGSAILTEAWIAYNAAGQRGGGVYVTQNAVVTGTELIGNVATSAGRGGGLFGERACQVANTLVADNGAYAGGGIYLLGTGGALATLRHVSVVSATVGSTYPMAAAVLVRGSGTLNITNTIIANYPYGIELLDTSTVNEDYNLYFGNGANFHIGLGTPTLNNGPNSLYGLDPRFVDPTTGDYHIDTDSAALDAGTFLGVTDDLDGDSRPTNPARPDGPDIGCDENKSLTVRRDVTDTMTFGAPCACAVLADTGSLSTITLTVVYTYPTGLTTPEPLRYYVITPTGAGPYTASLTLCYTQQEFDDSDVNPSREADLRLYRYNGATWEPYTSTVDTTNDVVTATLVTTFSQWAIAGPGSATGVDLVSFTATPVGNAILLEWETASEIDCLGFYLYRAGTLAGEPLLLNEALIQSQHPENPVGARYRFVDQTTRPGVSYYYWLEVVGVHGSASRHGPVRAAANNYRIYLPLIRK